MRKRASPAPSSARSDFQCLARLGRGDASAVEVYKACVTQANHGRLRPEESELEAPARMLLEARRQLSRGEAARAAATLAELEGIARDAIHEGDRLFLSAILARHTETARAASALMSRAARAFAGAYDPHRELRARINEQIFVSDLASCSLGELLALEQQARRDGFHDLVALVQRTRAIELLVAGKLAQALPEAMDSIRSYELDGDPEDRAVALGIAAIAELLSGEAAGGRATRDRVHFPDGKAAPFLAVFDALEAGKAPAPPRGHPLAAVPWSKLGLRAGSITGRLVAALQEGPATRDELIARVWGAQATHHSYFSRLHSAVRFARKTSGVAIHFDGQYYRLAK